MTAVNRQSFLCPLSMATGYLSVLLQPLGGAAHGFWCSYSRQGRSDWLRAQPEVVGPGFAWSETYVYYSCALLSVKMNTDVRPSVFAPSAKVLESARNVVSSYNQEHRNIVKK